VKRTRNHFRVSMQLRKLSRHRLLEVPHCVIPNLFRDPVLILSEDGGPLTDNLALCSDQRFFASVQRFLHRDAETSSDELLRFQNQQTLSYQSRLLRSLPCCHPELVSGSMLLPKNGAVILDGQRRTVLSSDQRKKDLRCEIPHRNT